MNNQIKAFEPQVARSEVISQMESMATSKFISLPEKFKESVFFAMEKLSTLKDIEQVEPISITKAFLKMFSSSLFIQCVEVTVRHSKGQENVACDFEKVKQKSMTV